MFLAHALLLWQRLLARLEIGNGPSHMAAESFVLAVGLATITAEQDGAVLAKQGRGIVAILAQQHRLVLRHMLGFHNGHQGKVDMQICRRRRTSLPAGRARKPAICASCLPVPAFQALPTERVKTRQDAGSARFLRVVRVTAERAADGVPAGIVALHCLSSCLLWQHHSPPGDWRPVSVPREIVD